MCTNLPYSPCTDSISSPGTLTFRCKRCRVNFGSDKSLNKHLKKKHKSCEHCNNKDFPSRGKLVDHYVKMHLYCIACDCFFDKPEQLEAHLVSSIHRHKPFCCLGKTCQKGFMHLYSLIAHLESGACKSGLTRAIVKDIVVRLDANNVITNPDKLIRGPDGFQAPVVELVYATPSSWNGKAYECFICHEEYVTLQSLDRHLQSPRHEESIYRCPNKNGCHREFKALGALCAHAQGNKCGVQQFQYAKEAVESLLAGLKTLEI